jgi:hypothetical protein
MTGGDLKDVWKTIGRKPEDTVPRRGKGAGRVRERKRIEDRDRESMKNLADTVDIAPSLSNGFDPVCDLQQELYS